jgi:PKD repeat protein
MPEVAKKYSMAPEKLKELFLTDSTLEVDSNLDILYVEPSVSETTIQQGSEDLSLTPELADSDAFNLNSSPNSTRIIYLDFTGHVVTGSRWNSYSGIPEIISAPFDQDGDPATFNDSERAFVTQTWARVADDYAAYDVNVTTKEPTIDELKKSDASDLYYGVRNIITPSNWNGSGGICYVNYFGINEDLPCYTFNIYSPTGTSETTSHEVGHAFGLHHDGTTTGVTYYGGHGIWTSLMGGGYQSVVQFSKGEYLNANNKEDDLAIIAARAPYHTDLVGNTPSSATPLDVASDGVIKSSGLIEGTNDVDVYSFTAGGGVAITVTPVNPIGYISPNLDPKVRILDSSGNVLIDSNPDKNIPVTAILQLTQGTYYVEVDGAGYLDASTGYTDYASIGRYEISGTLNYQSTVNQPPVAKISATPTSGEAPLASAFSSAGTFDPEGALVSYSWNFGDGSTSTVSSPSHTYSVPGTYTATLTVADSTGLTSTASVQIIVRQQANVTSFGVTSLVMGKGTLKRQSFADVSITLLDQNGNPVSGVTVTGSWSGGATGSGSALSGADGKVYIRSGSVNIRKNRTVNFTITNVTAPTVSTLNYVWNGIVSSGTITL